MLRIDVSKDSAYTIPDSNPYNNEANAKKEIWASGLRNPWRFSFDRLNGDLWIGDVGQGDWEEIDVEKYGGNGGLNYGWRCYEGNHEFNTSLCKAKTITLFPSMNILEMQQRRLLDYRWFCLSRHTKSYLLW